MNAVRTGPIDSASIQCEGPQSLWTRRTGTRSQASGRSSSAASNVPFVRVVKYALLNCAPPLALLLFGVVTPVTGVLGRFLMASAFVYLAIVFLVFVAAISSRRPADWESDYSFAGEGLWESRPPGAPAPVGPNL
jgi:hypothetical protein